MLQRLARNCFRRRWFVLGVWVAVLIGLNVLANGVIGSNFRTDFKLPATESRTVFEMLQKANPDRSGATSQIVFEDTSGVNTPEVQKAMGGLFQQVDELQGVEVTSPFDPATSGRQISHEATGHRGDVGVAEFGQRLGGEGRADTAGAVDDDRGGLVEQIGPRSGLRGGRGGCARRRGARLRRTRRVHGRRARRRHRR